MANYRTVRVLKPHKGAEIHRLHVNGRYYYYGYMGDGLVIRTHSLKELRKEINAYDKAELC